MTIGNHNRFFISLSGTIGYVIFVLKCNVLLSEPMLVYCNDSIRSPWPWGGTATTADHPFSEDMTCTNGQVVYMDACAEYQPEEDSQ